MSTFAEKSKATQQTKIPEASKRGTLSPEVNAHLFRRTVGEQVTHRLLRHEKTQTFPKEKENSLATNLSVPLLQQLRQTYSSGQVEHATSLVQKNLGEGRPLPSSVRAPMSRHFGRDFSSVRIHTDDFSSAASKALDANAFTIRNHIVFGSGMFRPQAPAGQMRLAHELAHVIQQTGYSPGPHDRLEQQASCAAVLGAPYLQKMGRTAPMIQREPTSPRRATSDQMITEARRVLSLEPDSEASDETTRMWSNVPSNFGAVTTGSIARRIWTHIFLRHFTEPEPAPGVESSHPRYLFSHQYGWIDAQHFFGFIDFAETQSQKRPDDQQTAFDAATAQGFDIEKKQQLIRDHVVIAQEPARDITRHMQVRPPNTPLFRLPVPICATVMMGGADFVAPVLLSGAQKELYAQLSKEQKSKFYVDAAKSAFTYEDFVSNQLGTRFFFQNGLTINSAPAEDREQLFLHALSTFFSSIQVENNQKKLDKLAQQLPTIERFEAPKTTEEAERTKHPELFQLP